MQIAELQQLSPYYGNQKIRILKSGLSVFELGRDLATLSHFII